MWMRTLWSLVLYLFLCVYVPIFSSSLRPTFWCHFRNSRSNYRYNGSIEFLPAPHWHITNIYMYALITHINNIPNFLEFATFSVFTIFVEGRVISWNASILYAVFALLQRAFNSSLFFFLPLYRLSFVCEWVTESVCLIFGRMFAFIHIYVWWSMWTKTHILTSCFGFAFCVYVYGSDIFFSLLALYACAC